MVERSQILGSQLPLTANHSIQIDDPKKPGTVVRKKPKKRLGGQFSKAQLSTALSHSNVSGSTELNEAS